jgi:hypothetical protein
MKRRAALGVLAVFAAALLALPTLAQVLDQIPADAMAVLKIRNLASVNEKMAALAKQFGIAEMTPAASDPLEALLGAGNIKQGLDKSGDAAIVMLNHDMNQAHDPPVIALIPVTDYAAFIKNFGDDAKKDGDYDVVHMTFNGQKDNDDTFVAHRGKFAVISDKKEYLDKKPDGFKAAGVTARELDTKDATLVVNFKVLGPKLNDQLKAHQEEWLADIEKTITGNEKAKKYAPLAKVFISQVLTVAQEFLTDAQFASFSINLNKEGIATSLMAEFTSDSTLGKIVAGAKNTDASLLAGLPDAKYLFFAGLSSSRTEEGQKFLADFFRPIRQELNNAGDDVKPITGLLDAMKTMFESTKGQTMGVIAPTGALGAAALIQSVILTTGDAKPLAEAQAKALDAEQKLMAMIPNQPETKITFTPNAKTVEGISFSQFTTEITGTDAIAMQAKQMMALMYGPGGPTGYSGVLDDQHLLTVQGLDDAMLASAVKAAREKTDSLSNTPGVQLVNKNLPQQRIGVSYIALDQIVITITNYAKMMGMPIPVNIKPDLPPLGSALATEGSAARLDSYIPADMVEAMITTGLQLKMMGGGRGKPGGL